jgi:hypothetical protein
MASSKAAGGNGFTIRPAPDTERAIEALRRRARGTIPSKQKVVLHLIELGLAALSAGGATSPWDQRGNTDNGRPNA